MESEIIYSKHLMIENILNSIKGANSIRGFKIKITENIFVLTQGNDNSTQGSSNNGDF